MSVIVVQCYEIVYKVLCFIKKKNWDKATNCTFCSTFKKRFVFERRKGRPPICNWLYLISWAGMNICYSGLNSRILTLSQ